MLFCEYLFSVKGILLMLIYMMITATSNTDVKNFENYGPYTIDYTDFQYCSGPKSKNLTYTKVEITKIDGNYVANINVTFLTQCSIDEVKIKVFKVENERKTILFNYKIDNPCQHFAFSSVIEKFFRANKCIVKKGIYNFNMSLNNITRIFYGKSTFYGEFQTKTTVISKQGNLICWVVNTLFSKEV